MPLKIIRQDITKLKVDAIVNAANESLLGGGGVDGCIHKAAGKELLEECKTLGGCKTGFAKVTKGYNLPCMFVIHTVGPRYKDGKHNEKELLTSCYRESLKIAKNLQCESVAFPLISSGIFGYPKAEALRVAVDTISEFLSENEMQVYITVFDKNAYEISEKLYCDIKAFIDDNYVDESLKCDRRMNEGMFFENYCAPRMYADAKSFIDDIDITIDESFSEMLLRKIDEKGMTDSECYKKANIDRKLFSKIRSDKMYRPSKVTAIAFAIALELDIDETDELLEKAGYALSHSYKFDIIIEYFITRKIYDVFKINEALFAFDQNLLGA